MCAVMTASLIFPILFMKSLICFFFLCISMLQPNPGVWASQLPSIRDKEDLSDSMLGFCVLFSYLGSVVVSPFSGALIQCLGSKRTTILGAVLYVFSVGAMAFVKGVPLLCVSFFAFGFCMGIMDVAMNACGVLAETVAEKPIMGSFHGCYSIAAAIGSLIGGLLTSIGWNTRTIFLVMCASGTATNLVCGQGLYHSKDEEVIEKRNAFKSKEHDRDAVSVMAAAPPTFMIPTGPALYVCAVGFLGSFGEGSMVTWLIIYFKDVLDASSINATVGFSIFMVFMGLGRFSCDKIRERIGRQRLVFWEGILVFVGMSMIVMSPSIEPKLFGFAVACVGCSLAGSGISTIIPTVFSTAGRLPGHHAGSAIATAAAISYAGSIVSPLLVGAMSDGLSSLRWAIMIDGMLLSLMTPLSYGIPPELDGGYAPLINNETDDYQQGKNENQEDTETDN